MILHRSPTEEERRISQRNYTWFNALNGASYMCQGDTVLLLIANHNLCSTTVIAILGAMTNLGYLLLPLGRLRTGQVGAAKSQADFWVCRNIASIIVASSVFVAPYSTVAATCMILLGSFLFYGFRAAGVVMSEPLLGNISTNDEMPTLLGRVQTYFQIFGIVSMIAVTCVLNRFKESSLALAAIVFSGASLGVVASFFLKRVRETDSIMKSARVSLWPMVRLACKDSVMKRQMVARAIINAMAAMLFSVSIAALKRGCHIEDSVVVFYTMILLAFSALSSHVFGKTMQTIGAKYTLLAGYLFFIPVCLFWILVPENITGWTAKFLFAVPMALYGCYSMLCANASSGYFIQSIPQEKQASYAVFNGVMNALLASFVSMTITPILLKTAEHLANSEFEMFRIYFVLTAILGCFFLVFILRLKNLKH